MIRMFTSGCARVRSTRGSGISLKAASSVSRAGGFGVLGTRALDHSGDPVSIAFTQVIDFDRV